METDVLYLATTVVVDVDSVVSVRYVRVRRVVDTLLISFEFVFKTIFVVSLQKRSHVQS